jgi:hypothetical protein
LNPLDRSSLLFSLWLVSFRNLFGASGKVVL